MKRFSRILRSILTFVSLILFIATAALWFRSQTNLDEFNIYRPRHYRSIWSAEGRIYLHLWSAPEQYWGERSTSFGGGELSRIKYGHIPFSHQFGPFGYGSITASNPALVNAIGRTFMFPHWFVLVILEISPALSFRCFMRRRYRAKNGLCIRCGYDVRATSTRCPECGAENAPAGAGGS